MVRIWSSAGMGLLPGVLRLRKPVARNENGAGSLEPAAFFIVRRLPKKALVAAR